MAENFEDSNDSKQNFMLFNSAWTKDEVTRLTEIKMVSYCLYLEYFCFTWSAMRKHATVLHEQIIHIDFGKYTENICCDQYFIAFFICFIMCT